jgi:SAM-dependent methyltransferase
MAVTPADPRADLERRKGDVVRDYGPWTAYNIELGHGVSTLGRHDVGAPEKNIARIAQFVEDFGGKPISELRVLDLGAYEGGFSVELASRGAQVVAVEAREPHVAKMQFAKDALGLDRLDVVRADVRELASFDWAAFDVVLCLGILYHLGAPDCFRLIETVAGLCQGLALVETQIAVAPREEVSFGGRTYTGVTYVEDLAWPGAAIDNVHSFWLTKASLLNLLQDVGFSSVAECLVPAVPETLVFLDHVTLIARKGEVVEPMSLNPEAAVAWRRPEVIKQTSHPAQQRGLLTGKRRSRALQKIFRRPGN